MTEIRYVCKDRDEKNIEEATIELNGESNDLLRGLCRIAANLKKKLDLKDGITFEDALLEGIKIVETEKKLGDVMNKKDKKLDELLDLLEKLIDLKDSKDD